MGFGDLSGHGFGGLGEYRCVVADCLVHMPENATFQQAAAVPMAYVTALQAMRNIGKLRPGQSILINGASGGVGSAAIQLAKYFGAKVTAVCSALKKEQALELGADQVLDYETEDFVALDEQFDLILAVNGNRSIDDYKRALSLKGTCVVIGGSWSQIFGTLLFGALHSKKNGKQIKTVHAKPNTDDLAFIAGLLAADAIHPVIEDVYAFEDTVAALEHIKSGHASGKLVVEVGGQSVPKMPLRSMQLEHSSP